MTSNWLSTKRQSVTAEGFGDWNRYVRQYSSVFVVTKLIHPVLLITVVAYVIFLWFLDFISIWFVLVYVDFKLTSSNCKYYSDYFSILL